MQFSVAGAGGTKTWIREYFVPSLEKHGLEIVPKAERARLAPVIEAAKLMTMIYDSGEDEPHHFHRAQGELMQAVRNAGLLDE